MVNGLTNLNKPDNIGIPNSFISVNWNNQEQITSVVRDSYSPRFYNNFIFKLPLVNKPSRKNKNALKNELDDIFREESEISFTVWLDSLTGTLYNSGEGVFTLDNLKNADKHVVSLFDIKSKKNVDVPARKTEHKLRLGSNEFKDSNMYLEIEVYIIMDETIYEEMNFEEYNLPRELSVLHPVVFFFV